MAFGNFKSLRDVALAYQISVTVDSFLEPIPRPVDERFQSELTWVQQNVAVRMSEASICEFLMAPVLKEVWKSYSDALSFWSHVPLGVEEPLVGVPDYFFSRRSPLGMVQDQPYVLVMEAKKDDFDGGWAQCLAAMLAAQQMNDRPTRIVYGCVSNGPSWEFGKLEGRSLTQEIRQFILSDLPGLFAAWNCVFAQAKEQALALLPPEWTDGKEVWVDDMGESAGEPDADDYFVRLEAAAEQISPQDIEKLEAALKEADELAKAQMRREMGLRE